MADGAFLGQAFVRVTPSFQGFQNSVRAEMGRSMPKVGTDAGRQIGQGVTDGLKGVGAKVGPGLGRDIGNGAGRNLASTLGNLVISGLKRLGSSITSTLSGLFRLASTAVAAGGAALVGFGVESFRTTARIREMDAALGAIAKSTGYSKKQMDAQIVTIQKTGVRMDTARDLVGQFARANLDMAKATDLARVAQDLAVLTQQDSSETLNELLYGIQTGNTDLNVFRQLNIQAGQAVSEHAKSMGKTTAQLTAAERQQALLNAVLKAGIPIAGTYASAMEEPGKVLRSFPRIFEQIRYQVGTALVDAFGPAILKAYELSKSFAAAIGEGGKLRPVLDKLMAVFKPLGETIAGVVERVQNWMDNLKPADIGKINDKLDTMGPLFGAITGGMGVMGVKSVPILGDMLGGINPVWAALAGMVLSTGEGQAAFKELGKAVGPPAKELLGKLTPAMERIVDAIIPMIEPFGRFVGFLVDGITPIIDKLDLTMLGESLGKMFDALGPLLPPLGELVAALTPIFIDALVQFVDLITQLLDLSIDLGLVDFLNFLTGAINDFNSAQGLEVGRLTQDADKIAEQLQKAKERRVEAQQRYGPTSKQATDALRREQELAKKLHDARTKADEAETKRRETQQRKWYNPPDWARNIGDSILEWWGTNVEGAVWGWWERNVDKPVANFFTGLWDRISGWVIDAAKSVASGFMTAFTETIPNFFSGAWAAVAGFFTQMWGKVSGAVTGAARTVAGGFMGALSTAWGALGTAVSAVYRKVIQPVFGAFSTAWEAVAGAFKWAWDTIIKPVLDVMATIFKYVLAIYIGIQVVIFENLWKAMSAAVKWAWETLIKPALDAMGAAFSWLWNTLLKPALDGIKAAWQAVGSAFQWVWNTLIKPVWDAISAAVSWVWNTVLKPIFGGMGSSFNEAGQKTSSVWTTIFKPVWDAMAAAARWLWNNIIKPIYDAMGAAWRGVANGIKWMYDTVIKPTWDAITGALRWLWNTVIKPVYDAMGAAWRGVSNGIRWMYDSVIKPCWDALGAALSGVRNGFQRATDFIRNVWDTMANAIRSLYERTIKWAWDKMGEGLAALRDTFQRITDKIGSIWNGLKRAVGVPVQFVVRDVINPLIRGGNKLLKLVGLDVKELPVPQFAAGGPVPGHARGRGDNVLATLRSGEWVLTDRQADFLGRDWLRTLPHFQAGGEVRHVPSIPPQKPAAAKKGGGFFDWLGDTFGGIWDATGGKIVGGVKELWNDAMGLIRFGAFKAFEFLLTPLRNLLEPFEKKGPPDAFHGYFARLIGKVLDATLEFVRGKSESEPIAGGADVGELVATILSRFPGLRVTSGFRAGDPGFHGRNLARDLGGSVADMSAAAGWIGANMTPALLEGIFKGPTNLSVKNGKPVPPGFWGAGTWAAHANHIHLAAQQGVAGGGKVVISGPVRDSAMKAVNARWPGQWPAFDYIVNRESGWNPQARNPSSGAFGLGQALPPSKIDPFGNRNDPGAQLAWMMSYIASRYGNPNAARAFWDRNHWYDNGGFLPTGASIAVNNTGRPEPVLTRAQWDAIATIADRATRQPAGRDAPLAVFNNPTFSQEVDVTLLNRKLAWLAETEAITHD